MSAAVLFIYPDRARRISAYLEPDGPQVGPEPKTYEDEIDPRDSQHLITDVFDVVPKLSPRSDRGLGLSHRGRFPVWLRAGFPAAGCLAVYWHFFGAFSLFWFLVAPGFATDRDRLSH